MEPGDQEMYESILHTIKGLVFLMMFVVAILIVVGTAPSFAKTSFSDYQKNSAVLKTLIN